MSTVRSFDVFDTLIARAVRHPTDIFTIVEKRLERVGFANMRLDAQNRSDQTILNIYHHYQALSGCSDAERDQTMEAEIQTELDHTFLVTETAAMVRDGDILVSDMYLREEDIWRILRHAGFDRRVTLYVSSGGKSQGYMYERLKLLYNIETHYGDNYHSDVFMAQQHGLPAQHVTLTTYTETETMLERVAPRLCAIVRQFRLQNPYAPSSPEYQLHLEQAMYNIPVLLGLTAFVQSTADAESRTRLLCITRDCVMLAIVMRALLPPRFDITLFHSSRIAFYNTLRIDPTSYVNYVKTCNISAPDALLIDIHASFRSLDAFFAQHIGPDLPRAITLDRILETPRPGVSALWHHSNPFWEILNVDNCGTLLTVDEVGRDIRTPPAYDLHYSRCMHAVVEAFCAQHAHTLRAPDTWREIQAVSPEFWSEFGRYCERQTLRTKEYVTHQTTDCFLTTCANECRTDKGDQYLCAHNYTRVYQMVLGVLLHNRKKFGVTRDFCLLEIGLNREGDWGVPSADMFARYFWNHNLEYHGVDINPSFKRFEDATKKRFMHTADQTQAQSLIASGCVIPHHYDMIIDDGLHASVAQQVSLAVMWDAVAPGGCYVVEDLHWQPSPESGVKTRELLQAWASGNCIGSEHLTSATAAHILATCDSIEFHDSHSRVWGEHATKNALAILWKKQV